MAKAGTIQSIIGTGTVTATDSDGKTREVKQGDVIYEGETLTTQGNVSVSLVNDNGDQIASLGPDAQLLIDETIITQVAQQDATVQEAAAMQAALEQGEQIDEEETAVGEEDRFDGDAFGFYEGDQDTGHVGTRSLDAAPAASREQAEGEVDNYNDPIEFLSAQGIEVDETDGLGNDVTGTISVDYGTPTGYLTLSADGAIWDAESNTLTFSQDGVDVWQMVVNQTSGEYTFTQLAAFDHGFDNNDHNALEEFEITVTATNDDGNSASFDFTAGILDDGPSITPQPFEGEGGSEPYDGEGGYDGPMTLAEGPDGSDDPLSIDGDESFGPVSQYVSAQELGIDFGTDGPGSVALSMDPEDTNWEWNEAEGALNYYQGEGEDRELAWYMQLDGEGTSVDQWNFNYDGGPLTINMLSERDGLIIDGDGETSDLDIEIRLYNEQGIQVAGNDDFDIDPATSGSDGSTDNYDSFLSFADGELPPGNYTLYVSAYDFDASDWDPSSGANIEGGSVGDYQVTFTGGANVTTEDGTIVSQGDGSVVGQGTIVEDTNYGYSFHQVNPINHTDTGDHDETASWDVNLTVTDSDGDTASAIINVNIDDDGPAFANMNGSGTMVKEAAVLEGGSQIPAQADVWMGTDESWSLINGSGSDVDSWARMAVKFGTDGKADIDEIVLSMNLDPEAGDAYTWDGGNNILTYFQDGVTASWQIQVNELGNKGGYTVYDYEFTQLSAIAHDTPGSSYSEHNEIESWSVVATAMDGDGDTDTQTLNVSISDDGPSLTAPDSALATLSEASVITADLSEVSEGFQTTINGLVFSAFAADGTEASLIDSGPGAGISSPADGTDGRFAEINYYDETASSEVLRMDMPEGQLGFQLEVEFAEFFNSASETEQLQITWFRNGVEIGSQVVDSADATGNATGIITVAGTQGFDRVEFSALDDNTSDGDNSDFGVASVSVSTVPADAISTAAGQLTGDVGEDGMGGFFLWDGSEQTDHIMAEDGSYEIFLDQATGEWVFYQYQPMEMDTLDLDVRLYDGDGDWDAETLTVELPDPVFIVGHDPVPDETNGDDVDGSTIPFTVAPETGPDFGEIQGRESGDILVGDSGASDYSTTSYNYIVEMDTSGSMGWNTSDIQNLRDGVSQMISNIFNQVNNTTDGLVKIQLQEFGNSIKGTASVTFDKTANLITVTDTDGTQTYTFTEDADGNGISDGLDDILAWVNGLDALGGTDYEDALEGANALVDASYDQNHVIFISDGEPGGGTQAHDDELAALAGNTHVNSIRAIGIGMAEGSTADGIMDDIDSTPQAILLGDASDIPGALDTVLNETLVDIVGSDSIKGMAGDDIIFGDVLNTDALAEDLADQGYSVPQSIADMPDGSGWGVFEALENQTDWTREDTIQYIKDHHEELAAETIGDNGEGRSPGNDFGHDTIDGGDGDDFIYGQEGSDIIDGGAGNDVIDGGSGFNTIDGGTGTDTLVLMSDSYSSLDFSNVSNMERVELGDDGQAQTLSISAQDVFAMSEGTSLEISGGGDGDELILDSADGWTQAGDTYTAQVNNGAGGLVDVSITVDNVIVTFDDQGNPVV